MDHSPTAAFHDCVPSEHSLRRILRATYIGLDFSLTLVGNLLSILVTRKVEEFSESAKVFITSLALADLGVALIACTSLPAEIMGHWIFPQWICVATFISFYTFTTVSVVMVIIMTFDRLLAIRRPLRYSLILPKRRSIVAVVAVWFACALSAVATTLSNEVVYNKCSAVCMTAGRDIVTSTASVAIFYVIPLVLILLMNIKIFWIARQHANHLTRHCRVVVLPPPEDAGRPSLPPRTVRGKAVGVVTTVTVAFAVSWSVYQVKLLHGAISEGHAALDEWLEFTAIWLGLTNSWWNVIIYSVMNRSFRKHARSTMLRLCPWCQHNGMSTHSSIVYP